MSYSGHKFSIGQQLSGIIIKLSNRASERTKQSKTSVTKGLMCTEIAVCVICYLSYFIYIVITLSCDESVCYRFLGNKGNSLQLMKRTHEYVPG